MLRTPWRRSTETRNGIVHLVRGGPAGLPEVPECRTKRLAVSERVVLRGSASGPRAGSGMVLLAQPRTPAGCA